MGSEESLKGLSVFFTKSLDVLFTFCRTKSYLETQKILGLSESAVSRQLSGLEKALGVELVDKACRPFVPTANALFIARSFATQLGPVAEALNQVLVSNEKLVPFRIGCLSTLSTDLMPSLLRRIRGHSSHTLCLGGSSDDLISRLVNRELDSVFVSREFGEVPDVRRHFIFEEPTVLFLPKAAASHGKKWTWGQLRLCGIPFIRFRRSGRGILSDTWLNSIGMDFPDRIECDRTELILRLVSQGEGWSMTRLSSILPYQHLLGSIEVAPTPDPLPRRIYCIDRAGFPADLHELLVRESLAIFETELLPKIASIVPWAAPSLRVGTAGNPLRS